MTKDEAIMVLNMVEAHGLADEAKRMAIESLSAEPSGDLISRQTLIGAIEKCGEEKIYPQALVETIKALPAADVVKAAYICDGRKCGNDCSDCFRTTDIEHARDFKLLGDTYFQQEQAGRPKVNSAEWIAEKERQFEELQGREK